MNLLKNVENIYSDSDGVLFDFEGQPNAIARFDKEVGFFENLAPINENILALKILIRKGANVHILSASPNEQADSDKLKAYARHLPELSRDKIILCRLGEDKSKYIEQMQEAIFFDYYSENLIKWKANGGLVVKVVNSYDNKIGRHTKHNIPYVSSLLELL